MAEFQEVKVLARDLSVDRVKKKMKEYVGSINSTIKAIFSINA